MAINKVEFGDQTLMDLTGDTVTPEDVLNGATFHDRAGVSRSGTASYPVTDVQVNNTSVLDGTVAKITQGTAATKDVPASGNASTSQVVMGNDSRLTDSRPASDVSSWAKASTKPSYTASEVGAIATTAKGANGGVAELDSTGKVPSSQLPSFVDDVLEYDSLSNFPTTGETGKIYIAKDTNKTYRWSGTTYVEISASLALGETSSTAYRGDRGKTAYDHSQVTSGNPHNVTKSDVGLGNVPNVTTDNQTPTVTEASTRANIATGDTLKTIIGKIKKFFTDLKTVAFTGSYNDLTNKPTIPTVNNATLTIQKNGTNVQTFTANASTNATANITVPTKVSELTNDSGYTTNIGTVTQVKVGTTAYNPSSGVISLPAYPSDTNTHRPIQVNGTEILGNNTTALNLKAGSNVSLSNSSGTVTIAATDNDTKNTAGSTDTSSKIFLIGATSQAANPQTYSDNQVYVTSGTLQANIVSASAGINANTANSGAAGGVSLYSDNPASYGITMRNTGTSTGQLGKHGYVQGDWAGYLCFSGATNRGYIFRQAGSNVASVSGEGHAVFNGSVTIGGNAANTSGARMQYNSTNQCIDFVFV